MNHKFQYMIYNFRMNKSVKKFKSVKKCKWKFNMSVWQCPQWICVCKWKKIRCVWMTNKKYSHRNHMQRKVKKECCNHINLLADL